MKWTVRDDALNILTLSVVRFHITQVEVSVLSVEMIEVSFVFINIYVFSKLVVCIKMAMH
jgi:hypothetical protein